MLSMNSLPPRALIVDDDASIRAMVRTSLERQGARTREVADTSAALQELAAGEFDLLVLDLALRSEDDGMQLLQRVRARPELDELRVIMLTASGEPTIVTRGFAEGAHDWVTKPFNFGVLSARLGAALKESRRAARKRRVADAAAASAQSSREELAVAMEVQRAAFPHLPTEIGYHRFSGDVFAAGGLSGDVIDIVRDRRGRTTAFLLDAAGHGLAASIIASVGRGALAQAFRDGLPMDEALQSLRKALADHREFFGSAAAVVALRFDEDARTTEVVNAGMPPVLVWDARRKVVPIRAQVGPVGLHGDVSNCYDVIPNQDCAAWMLTSDGLTDGRLDADVVLALARDLRVPSSLGISGAFARIVAPRLRALVGDSPTDDASLLLVERTAWSPS